MKKAVALGTFDGIHKGHLAVLNIPDIYEKTALTFKIPPKASEGKDIGLLLDPKEKEERLKNLGFKVEYLDFARVKNLSPLEFLEDIKNRLNPQLIACGFNHCFGKNASGDTELLRTFCLENGIELVVAPPVELEGEVVSSSRIRALLEKGEIEKANRLLSEDFSFTGEVIHGDGRGKGLGFPTLNQRYGEGLVPLKFGVYQTETETAGKKYKGITNIGVRPTYPTDYIISETFLGDFKGDLYGTRLKIRFKKFIRAEKRFSSEEELKKQVLKDIGSVMNGG